MREPVEENAGLRGCRPPSSTPLTATPRAPDDRRKFKVTVTATFEIDVSRAVLDSVADESWQNTFYRLPTAGDVVEHLAFNLVQGRAVSELDGFADVGVGGVVTSLPFDLDGVEVDELEVLK